MKRKRDRRKDMDSEHKIVLGKPDNSLSSVARANTETGYNDYLFSEEPVTANKTVATTEPKDLLRSRRGAGVIKLILIIAIALVVVTVLVFGIANLLKMTHKETKESEPTPTTAASSSSMAPSKDDAIEKARELLLQAGWEDDEYILEVVDPSKDGSTTGDGAFTKEGIKNSTDLLVFLNSGKDSSNALLLKIMEQTGAGREEVLEGANWIVVQSNISFKYPGNTSYKNGMIVDVGTRDGLNGDIFMLFISPDLNSAVAVRGACGNPQEEIPKPKSSNPADYKQPGDDKKKDSGTGVKPPVPSVSVTPEATPPVVVTVAPTGAIVAPGATPLPTQAPGTTPTPTLVPEPGINPGDPGNPFG